MITGTRSKTFALALGVLSLCPAVALAQAWPGKPIRLIVPFPPGGATDFVGRIVGQGLSERLGQQILVDNRAGADGILGLDVLKKSPPDGYTIATVSAGPLSVNPHLYVKLPYDTLRDFTAIANMVSVPLLLVSHPSLPIRNVKELIALSKRRPGEIIYSSPGVGNSSHLASELFNSMAKVKMVHVPYKGMGPAVLSLLSGEGQLLFSSIPPILPHVRSGKAISLGIGSAQRVPSLPEIPTIAESGLPGYEAYSWTGMVGPANMPRDVVQRLNKEIIEILKQKNVSEQLLTAGTVPTPSSPEEFAAYIKSEIKKWGEVVKMADIKAH